MIRLRRSVLAHHRSGYGLGVDLPTSVKLRLLNQISTNNIKGDLFGGVTAAVIALPMALAFGVASGAGAAAGPGAPCWWASLRLCLAGPRA